MEPTTDDGGIAEAETRPPRLRHPLLTALLVWLLVANLVAAVSGPFLLPSIRRPSIPDFPDWAGWAFGGLSAAGAVCVWALFRWRRWGFYGYLLVAGGVFAVNVAAGVGPAPAALGFVGSVILFVALQIGGRKRAWPQMTCVVQP